MTHFIVAFIHEAKPLIAHYRLTKRAGKHPYPIYENESFRLIISGVGKVSAAGAVAYLQGRFPSDDPVLWLNIGIAGHRNQAIGSAFMAHSICDAATGTRYFPPLIGFHECGTQEVRTVDVPERDYDTDCLYDMEASGFYQAALKSTTIEWIHSYKIVSDNLETPIPNITKNRVIELISAQLSEIDAIMSSLQKTLREQMFLQAIHPERDSLLKRWHFTVTQRIQLEGLLQRFQALSGRDAELPNLLVCENAKACLKALEKSLLSLPWAL